MTSTAVFILSALNATLYRLSIYRSVEDDIPELTPIIDITGNPDALEGNSLLQNVRASGFPHNQPKKVCFPFYIISSNGGAASTNLLEFIIATIELLSEHDGEFGDSDRITIELGYTYRSYFNFSDESQRLVVQTVCNHNLQLSLSLTSLGVAPAITNLGLENTVTALYIRIYISEDCRQTFNTLVNMFPHLVDLHIKVPSTLEIDMMEALPQLRVLRKLCRFKVDVVHSYSIFNDNCERWLTNDNDSALDASQKLGNNPEVQFKRCECRDHDCYAPLAIDYLVNIIN